MPWANNSSKLRASAEPMFSNTMIDRKVFYGYGQGTVCRLFNIRSSRWRASKDRIPSSTSIGAKTWSPNFSSSLAAAWRSGEFVAIQVGNPSVNDLRIGLDCGLQAVSQQR